MSCEYEELERPDLLGQGDVIAWDESVICRPWKCFGIVVTADCDLAKEKHAGQITYLPAFTTEDFIWHYWRVPIFEKEFNSRIEKLTTRINRWLEKNGIGSAAVSAAATERWVRRAGCEGLLDELGCTDPGQRSNIAPLIEAVSMILAVLDAECPDFDALDRAYPLIKKGATGLKDAALDFQTRLGSLPGDVFHLPTLPGKDDDGLFVMLRHVQQCRLDEIALRPDDLRFGSATATRVARLSPIFRYALTQAFGRVFTDIGLPEDHEERRKTHSERYFRLGQG